MKISRLLSSSWWILALLALSGVHVHYRYSVGPSIESNGRRLFNHRSAVAAASVHPLAIKKIPGPMQVPVLGSIGFMWRHFLRNEPLPALMKEYGDKYGEIFELKGGPIRQYWVRDAEGPLAEMLMRGRIECTGRSELKEPSFGDEFLFLTRDGSKAKMIRKKQKQWLKERVNPNVVNAAVTTAFAAFVDSVTKGLENIDWNQRMLERCSVRALLGALIGGGRDGSNELGWLSEQEIEELVQVTALYRRRQGLKGTSNSPTDGSNKKLESKEHYARRIETILRTALSRCPTETLLPKQSSPFEIESEDVQQKAISNALPLLVSAIVGGSEIYPLLLQWAARHLAVTPALQKVLREDSTSRSPFYGSLTSKAVSYLAWAHPYSAAIGPPRKINADFDVSVPLLANHQTSSATIRLIKDSLLFVLHPGLRMDWSEKWLLELQKFRPTGASKFNLTASEACWLSVKAGKDHARTEVEQCRSLKWPMFGMGERSCIAAEMSSIFLASFLSLVLRKYEICVKDENCTIFDLFAYEEDGSLLIPKNCDGEMITLKAHH